MTETHPNNADEWAFDSDGNPEWIGPPKEEPYCYACSDGGIVATRGLARLWKQRRPCPDCRPTRLDIAQARFAAWRRRFLQRTGHARADGDDEAPF